MNRLFRIECDPPWLIAQFSNHQRMASWSLNRPGLVEAGTVAWLQVRDADLPVGVDPLELLERRLAERELGDAVGLMTAREIEHHHIASSGDGRIYAEAMVTLGLTNGVTLDGAGHPINLPAEPPLVGTINMLVAVSAPLSTGAMLEAMSIAAVARTAALLADGRIVGTGTDCIVIACPDSLPGEAFAGLHTSIGAHITASVLQAVRQARERWVDDAS